MGNLRDEIHERAQKLASGREKVESFLKDRVKLVSRSMQDQVDAGAKSVTIETVKVWLGFLNPQLGITSEGEVIVTQERVKPLTTTTGGKGNEGKK